MTTLIPKYERSGSNVNRPINEKLDEIVSVLDYATGGTGTDGDPYTGWDTNITWGANTYYMPEGVYAYSTPIDFDVNGITLAGAGGKATILKFTGTGNAINIGGPDLANLVTDVTVRDLSITGTATAVDGIYINWAFNIILENVAVGNITGAGVHTGFIVLGKFENVQVYEYYFSPTGYTTVPTNGLLLGRPVGTGGATYPDTNAVTIIDPNIQGCSGSGIKGLNGFNNTIIGGSSEYNTGYGYELLADWKQNSLVGTNLEGNDSYCAGFENSFYGMIIPSSSTQFHLAASAANNKIIGGTIGNVLCDVGTAFNLFEGVTVPANLGFVDNSSANVYSNTFVNQVPFNKFTGNLNAATVIGASMYSQGGVTASTASGTPVTLFTSTFGSYMLTAYIPNEGVNFHASSFVIDDSTACGLSGTSVGSGISLSVSGKNIQATQTTGASKQIIWSVIRMPSF